MNNKIISRLELIFKKAFSKKYLLLSNTITSGLLFVAGDFIEQKIEIHYGKHKDHDKDRMTRMGIIGLSEGPPHHYFYNILEKYLPGKTPKMLTGKILADQLIMAPIFTGQFFFGMALLERKSLKESWLELKAKFPTTYLVDWLIWPPCQLINFYLIPLKYRVLYVNFITVFWNVFLSYMKHYDQIDKTV